MTFSLPPVVRLAKSLARDIENAVTRFRREHRHTFGADLRRRSSSVLFLSYSAASYPDRRGQLLDELRDAMDALTMSIQLGWELRQFASFRQFEALSRDALKLGRQIGGWHRHVHPQGQNGPSIVTGQRAKTLSTRAASKREANR